DPDPVACEPRYCPEQSAANGDYAADRRFRHQPQSDAASDTDAYADSGSRAAADGDAGADPAARYPDSACDHGPAYT
ncbi:hypothetical protein K4H03_25250, partial [Mycobacterium tuberculosis]|nr:hypothetical protein [Mycobacterium tuberculosis]